MRHRLHRIRILCYIGLLTKLLTRFIFIVVNSKRVSSLIEQRFWECRNRPMSVRNAILGLLADHPRHGYELRAAFEALAGGEALWSVKPAQVYTTLARLEELSLIHI